MDFRSYFKGKKVTQLGLGLLGRGVGDAEFLARMGAELIVTDLKSADELKPSLERLKAFPNIVFHLGGHRLEDFRGRDLILKAAGVPLDSPFVAEAEKQGIPVEMDASLFAKLSPKLTLIGVTGTRGKSTTSVLIYEILKHLGKRAFLAGNIRDTATLPLLEKTREDDCVVLELDSWQLQGFGAARFSPHIAVFTTFLPDHMNYYHGSMKQYFEDKANIFRFQKPDDYLIVGEDIAKQFDWRGAGKLIVAKRSDVPPDWVPHLPGEHNRLNAACAMAVARLFGAPRDYRLQGVFINFGGLTGRLEPRKIANGITYYNDTNATTPDATVAGMRAIAHSKNIVLIMGGSDKGLDAGELVAEIPKHCKAVVLIPGTGTEKVRKEIRGSGVALQEAEDLDQAVEMAKTSAAAGDIVLFSPAFASFGQFKNEYDRGERFLSALAKST